MNEESTGDLSKILEINVTSNLGTQTVAEIREHQIKPNVLHNEVFLTGVAIKTRLMEIVCKNFLKSGNQADSTEITVSVKMNNEIVTEKTQEVKKNSDLGQSTGSLTREVMKELPFYICQSKEFKAQ